MGWLYSDRWRTKNQLRDYLVTICGKGTVMHRTVGNHLWVLYIAHDDRKFICLFLMAADRRKGWWGYKDISEEMGPIELDCPLALLEAASPPPNEYATKWRESVRYWHEQKNKQRRLLGQLKEGAEVPVVPGLTGKDGTPITGTVRILSVKPLRAMYNGTIYRLKPSYLVLGGAS